MYGKRVNLDEIEQLMKAEFNGVGTACTGEDDHLRIFMEEADEDFCTQAAAWLAEKTGIHPRGIQVLPIAEIPKNDAGKTLYHALK